MITSGHINREARALAACEGKYVWENVSEGERARFRLEAKEIAETVLACEPVEDRGSSYENLPDEKPPRIGYCARCGYQWRRDSREQSNRT